LIPVLVDARKLSKRYRGPEGDVQALSDVSLSVDENEFVVVRGPSGSGKSTLLMTIGGLLTPDSGTVTVCGDDPYALSPDRRARFRAENIGFVFQRFHIVPYLTVHENVLSASMALGTEDAEQRATELIRRFGLADRARHVPAELSTGERQRTALARAMLNGPRLVLADEPTGNLDEANGRVVLGALAEFATQNRSVLVVTHDPAVEEFARRTVCLEAGRITGPSESVKTRG
jgi:ABC-type lipoprotein export system ATPase subunit